MSNRIVKNAKGPKKTAPAPAAPAPATLTTVSAIVAGYASPFPGDALFTTADPMLADPSKIKGPPLVARCTDLEYALKNSAQRAWYKRWRCGDDGKPSARAAWVKIRANETARITAALAQANAEGLAEGRASK
jgi:hypothetical protein